MPPEINNYYRPNGYYILRDPVMPFYGPQGGGFQNSIFSRVSEKGGQIPIEDLAMLNESPVASGEMLSPEALPVADAAVASEKSAGDTEDTEDPADPNAKASASPDEEPDDPTDPNNPDAAASNSTDPNAAASADSNGEDASKTGDTGKTDGNSAQAPDQQAQAQPEKKGPIATVLKTVGDAVGGLVSSVLGIFKQQPAPAQPAPAQAAPAQAAK